MLYITSRDDSPCGMQFDLESFSRHNFKVIQLSRIAHVGIKEVKVQCTYLWSKSLLL